MATEEIKVSDMTFLETIPDDAKIYIVKPGDTTPYYTTKAALLAGISSGTTPNLTEVLNVGSVANNVEVFLFDGDKRLALSASNVEITNLTDGNYTFRDDLGLYILDSVGNQTSLLKDKIITENGEYQLPTGVSSPLTTQNYVDTEINDAVAGLLDDRGNHDASTNLFPSTGGSGTAGAILKGDLWTISVAGTLGGVAVTIGDVVRALVDSPGTTATNWVITENNIGYVPENNANKTGTVSGNETSTSLFASLNGITSWIKNNLLGWVGAHGTAIVDADTILVGKSGVLGTRTWAQLKSNLSTYFDMNNRRKQVIKDVTGASVSGTTSETLIKTYEIPINTLTTGGFIDFWLYTIRSAGSSNLHRTYIKIYNSNTPGSAITIADGSTGSNFLLYSSNHFKFVLRDNLIKGVYPSSNSNTSLSSGTQVSAACNNTTGSVWIFVFVTPGNTNQTIDFIGFEALN